MFINCWERGSLFLWVWISVLRDVYPRGVDASRRQCRRRDTTRRLPINAWPSKSTTPFNIAKCSRLRCSRSMNRPTVSFCLSFSFSSGVFSLRSRATTHSWLCVKRRILCPLFSSHLEELRNKKRRQRVSMNVPRLFPPLLSRLFAFPDAAPVIRQGVDEECYVVEIFFVGDARDTLKVLIFWRRWQT